MGAFLTLSHEGGSRNPSSYVSGRHTVGPRGQLGRHPLCRVCWGYLLRAKHFPIAHQRCWGCRDLGERYEKIKIKILKHTVDVRHGSKSSPHRTKTTIHRISRRPAGPGLGRMLRLYR